MAHTYREINILTQLWGGYLSRGRNYLQLPNGIIGINYESLVRKKMVECVPVYSVEELERNITTVESLIFEALSVLHMGGLGAIRKTIDILEEADLFPTGQQWGYRLTEKAIEHMRTQKDAILDFD